MTPTIELLREVLEAGRGRHDGGEEVDDLTHGLLTAGAVQRAGLEPQLVCAALFHDIGWTLVALGLVSDSSAGHEELAATFLRRLFPEKVWLTVLNHTDALGLLVLDNPQYQTGLSPISLANFQRRGGVPSREEAATIRNRPYMEEACLIRQFDDGVGKSTVATPPSLDDLWHVVQASAR